MLERQHLQMLKTIEEVGTVTKAASILCLSQSALSHAMKKLEHQLGIAVWRKVGRNLVLTDAGVKILSAANRILPQFQRFEADLAAMQQGFVGTLKLGIECYPCFQWLLKVVAPYLREYPGVDVDIKNEFQFGGLGALFNHDIDLLITPDPLHKKGIDYIKIFGYEQVLLVHEGHELAGQTFIRPEALANQILFTYPIEASRLDVFSQFLGPCGRSVKQHKRLENTEMIVEMVKNGRGVAVLPDWLVADSSDRGGLIAIRLGPNGLKKTTYIAVRAGERDSEFVDAFVSLAQSLS